MNRLQSLALGLAAVASLAVAAEARADDSGVKAGVLTCNVAGGWGFILGSSKDLDCTFSPDGIIAWGVFAPSATLAPGSLAGSYGGVTAGAAAGVGAGAHVLVGGSDSHISLQPLSVEGMTGLNVAGGIGAMTLTAAP
jgi:hypothetical protein